MTNLRFTFAVLSLFAVLLAGGCAGKKQPPFTTPPLQPAASHFVGTALSGCTGAKPTASANAATVPAVRATFIALERMPVDIGKALGTQVRLVVADRAGGPILPSPLLTRDARLVELRGASDPLAEITRSGQLRHGTVATMEGMLPREITAAFSVAEPVETQTTSTDPPQRRIEISVRHITGNSPRYEYALMVDDVAPSAPPPDADRNGSPPAPAAKPAAREIQREMAVLDRPATPAADAIAIVLPSKHGMAEAIAAIIEVLPPADNDQRRQSLATALRQAAQAADTAASRPRVAPLAIAEVPGFAVMLASLARPEARRPALAYLSSRTSARICEDLSLVGDDDVLAGMADHVQKNMAQISAAKTPDELGWLLERTCLELLADLADKGKLSPELQAVLMRNLGEAGRQTASIQEVLRGSGNQPMFDARVIAENLLFLEDASPASRVRAFDWLKSRGKAPPGFDPLGNARQRRDALEQARAAATGGKP